MRIRGCDEDGGSVVSDLTSAWREVEETLPKNWAIESLRHSWNGWVAAVAQPAPDPLGTAKSGLGGLGGPVEIRRLVHDGPPADTPVGALTALAERLRAMGR